MRGARGAYRHKYIPPARPKNYRPRFEDYEQLKRQWTDAHPHATHEEYQQAMREIAAKCGI